MLLDRRSRTIALVAVARLHGRLRGAPSIGCQRPPHIVHLPELALRVPLRKHLIPAGVDQLAVRDAAFAIWSSSVKGAMRVSSPQSHGGCLFKLTLDGVLSGDVFGRASRSSRIYRALAFN